MMSRDQLYQRLKSETQVFQNARLEEAFRAVDRADFVEEDYKPEAYEDYPLPIPEGQTISQPTVVFFMLELLNPEEGDIVADIGAGSGYTTALLAHLVGRSGRVFGFEARDRLVDYARENIKRFGLDAEHIQQASNEALREHGPYDKVLISAASVTIPDILRVILKDEGFAVLVVDDSLVRVKKTGESFTVLKQVPGFSFTPYIEND